MDYNRNTRRRSHNRYRRRRRNETLDHKIYSGAFIERFELLPSPQPPPHSLPLQLTDLTFAVSDNIYINDYVTGIGNPDWKRTHDPVEKSSIVVELLLKNGATLVGKTVMDELAFGNTGENMHYGTPTNTEVPSQIPGGSSSCSAVAIADKLVGFSTGTDIVDA